MSYARHKFSKRSILFLCVSICALFSVQVTSAAFDLKQYLPEKGKKWLEEQQQPKGIPGPSQIRQQHLAELKARLEEIKKEVQDVKNEYRKQNTELLAALAATQEKLKAVPEGESLEHYEKTISYLNDRKQHLGSRRDAVIAMEDITTQHVRVAEEVIEALAARDERAQNGQAFYVLRDLREIQHKIASHVEQVQSERSARDQLARQKRSEEDDLFAVNQNMGEVNALLKEAFEKGEEKTEELLRLRQKALEDKKHMIEAIARRIELELAFRKDKIGLLEIKLGGFRKRLAHVQEGLNVTQSDIEVSRKELEDEKKKVREQVTSFSRVQERRKAERADAKNELERLEPELKAVREEKKEDSAEGRLLLATEAKLKGKISHLDHEIHLLGVRREVEEHKVLARELHQKFVEVAYNLQRNRFERRDIEQWLGEFSRERAAKEGEIKSLDDQRNQIVHLLNETKRQIEDTNASIEKLKEVENTVFKGQHRKYTETSAALTSLIGHLERQTSVITDTFSRLNDLDRMKEDLVREYTFIERMLEQRRIFDIWRRSPNALSVKDATQSLLNLKEFLLEMLWFAPTLLNPVVWIGFARKFDLADFVGLMLLLLLLVLFMLVLSSVLGGLERALIRRIAECEHGTTFLVLNLSASLVSVAASYRKLFSSWLFVQLDMLANFKQYFGPFAQFISYTDSPQLKATFYLFSVPILLFFTRQFITHFTKANQQLGYPFYTQQFEAQLTFLLKMVLFSAATLLPLRAAIMGLYVGIDSPLPAVMLATFTLILQLAAVLLLFFHRDELIRLLPQPNWFWRMVVQFLEQHIPFVFMFILVLLVLSNPYVGYSNFAYLLLYAVPLSLLLIYGLFGVHYYVRQNSVAWFLIEEDDEVADRFEHAKTYYGIFVMLSFTFLALLTFMAIAEVWGVTNSYELLKYLLTERWTVVIAGEKPIGILDFVRFSMYIAAGFLLSTLVDKFVLTKIFDIMRMELGLRNTLSTLFHYTILYFVIVIGLRAIHLEALITALSWVAGGGIVLASTDLLKDLIGGLLLFLERPVEIGSFIEAGDKRGTVLKISPRSTIIRNLHHHSIVIPNRELMAHPISNWGFNRVSVGFDVTLVVSYGEDPLRVRGILKEVVDSDPRILRVPRAVCRMANFGNDGMEFLVRAFISARRVREQWDIAADLRMGIFAKFKEENIRLAWPHRVLHLSGDQKNIEAIHKAMSVKFFQHEPSSVDQKKIDN